MTMCTDRTVCTLTELNLSVPTVNQAKDHIREWYKFKKHFDCYFLGPQLRQIRV